MFPVHNGVARRYPAIITWALIIANVCVFLYQISLPPRVLEQFVRTFALIPARFFGAGAGAAGGTMMAYAPLVTSLFLHAGWGHLIINMWTLWVFGPAVEDRLGALRFAIFYLLAGMAASLAHALLHASSAVPVLGASGAIAGVIGCYVRLFPLARLVIMMPLLFFPIFFEVPAVLFAAVWLWAQIMPGLTGLLLPVAGGGIAWWAHIGGFCAGWVLAPLVLRPRRTYRRYYADEGRYGLLPNGRRHQGAVPWV